MMRTPKGVYNEEVSKRADEFLSVASQFDAESQFLYRYKQRRATNRTVVSFAVMFVSLILLTLSMNLVVQGVITAVMVLATLYFSWVRVRVARWEKRLLGSHLYSGRPYKLMRRAANLDMISGVSASLMIGTLVIGSFVTEPSEVRGSPRDIVGTIAISFMTITFYAWFGASWMRRRAAKKAKGAAQ